MASQPLCSPSSPKAVDKNRKTALQESTMQLPLDPVAKSTQEPHRMPWDALVKSYTQIKLSILEAQQGRLLASLNPLDLNQDLPPPLPPMAEKKSWGDQEPLSKVRTTPRVGAVACSARGEGTSWQEPCERPIWLC